MENKTIPLVSVIVPVCNEEENLEVFYETLIGAIKDEPNEWEIVFIDDGSTDCSFDLLREIHSKDKRVKVLRFTRNFGSHVAIAAGLQTSLGDAAVIMAADLQDPPRLLQSFLEEWRKGAYVVWGVRRTREDPFFQKITSKAFYWLIKKLAFPSYPSHGSGSFCLLDRSVIDTFDSFRERNRVTFGLIAWAGFPQAEVLYERPRRKSGKSKWNFRSRLKVALDTLLSFSHKPVRFISFLGFIISIPSLAIAFFLVIRWFLVGTTVVGWTSLIVSSLFLGGVQLLAIGALGEYLWRILEETKSRPLFVVREKLGDFK